MPIRRPSFRWSAGIAAALLMGLEASAQLSPVSPFLPPNSGPAGVQSETNAIELRGVMPTAHGTLYLLCDPLKKTSVWVGVNESGAPYLIKSADPKGEAISVRVNGQTVNLTLKTAHVAASSPNGFPGGGPPGSVVGTVVLRPTAEDEQRRLQAVADEVRRRRQAREQAALQQSSAPGAPR